MALKLSLTVVHGLNLKLHQSGVIYVKIDRKRKIPVTTLTKSSWNDEAQMREAFGHVDHRQHLIILDATLKKDPSRGSNEALIEIYRRLRPGDLATVENARSSN